MYYWQKQIKDIPVCRLSQINFDLNWNESAEVAFLESKQILASMTLLVHPSPLRTVEYHVWC